jgi:hypothetical protein
MVFVLEIQLLPSSAVTINLSLPNPAFMKAFTNVPAKFPLAESTFAEIPGPVREG